jgi:hypothetical protein
MKQPYIAPQTKKLQALLEKNIADTLISVQGKSGEITQDTWDDGDTEIIVDAAQRGDFWVGY